MSRVAVVGHVEWADFAVVERLPRSGEILAAREAFAEPGGGGAVAAVQLGRLAGGAAFFTSLGDDELGARAGRDLAGRHGLRVHAVRREGVAQRRALVHLADDHERTITVVGERHVPHGADPLPWDDLAAYDAVYFTGGDVEALRRARAARVLVATPRAIDALAAGRVALDVLVASAQDAGEQVAPGRLDPAPRHVVLTEGAGGGRWMGDDGAEGRWPAAELPGVPVDSYGSGDSFAAGLTCGLGAGLPLAEAIALGARCGAQCLTGRGPYGAALTG